MVKYILNEAYFIIEYNNKKKRKNNNILGLLFSIGGIFCIANIIAIYNFFKIVSNM